MATFEEFAAAIAGQESGGDYSAVNGSSGALGRYQVMPANVGPWSRETLGYTVTPQQFLASPDLQDRIALGKLRRYWDAYGPRGAAAAWYSGNPQLSESTAPQPGGPSIKGYVDSVMARMGAGGGGAVPVGFLGDAVGDIAGTVGGVLWDVGRPLLVTVVLLTAGGGLVVMGAWRATQRAVVRGG